MWMRSGFMASSPSPSVSGMSFLIIAVQTALNSSKPAVWVIRLVYGDHGRHAAEYGNPDR